MLQAKLQGLMLVAPGDRWYSPAVVCTILGHAMSGLPLAPTVMATAVYLCYVMKSSPAMFMGVLLPV
jgi:hypothetical protein